MNIYANAGSKVRFLGRNGHDCELEHALKILKVGNIYTVDGTEVHNFSSTVSLREFPDEHFNTVMFEDEVDVAPCPSCASLRSSLAAEKGKVERLEDIEGMAKIICHDVCQSPETPDDLWESVPDSVKDNWINTARAVRDYLLGRK